MTTYIAIASTRISAIDDKPVAPIEIAELYRGITSCGTAKHHIAFPRQVAIRASRRCTNNKVVNAITVNITSNIY